MIYDVEQGHRGKVYLDGQDVSNACFRCCPQEGWLERHVTDKDGQFIIEGGEIKTERITGEVRFVQGRKQGSGSF